MRGEPGTSCELSVNHWGGDPPVEGDFIITASGACYRIDGVRRRRPGSKTWGVLKCTRLERHAVRAGDPGVFEWEWAPRR